MLLRRSRLAAWLAVGILSAAAAGAQQLNNNVPDEPEWVESDTPAAPAFDINKLVDVTVDAQGALRYGVDPATLQIGKDGVVRYVMVARSTSGAMTAMYEGVRCSTGEYKLYARYNVDKWTPVGKPEWKSLWESTRIKHPLAFARQGGCDSKAPPSSVGDIVRRLKSPAETVYPS
ncbi:CNP1-like family protein [Pseudorhodoferax soli]|uniref:CNP1-like family protein n=1 Tax=Pseudorhodoferax soli TaxID=545864 RepID=A0A368Y7B9_9BURK|nr:CNP1-like family protein [Pseudorhodoferax soli]RCW76180.1 CNP1-like family protein [Pseudorhodoferax soli]